MTVRMARSHGQKTSTVEVPVDELRGGFRGCLITSEDADYEAARKVWNGLIDRRPGLIAALAHRDAVFALNVDSFWHDPAESEKNVRWVQEFWRAMRAYAPRGSYVNFLTDEGEDRVRESHGGNYDRLAEIKRRYDPTNLFHLNQNIKPKDRSVERVGYPRASRARSWA